MITRLLILIHFTLKLVLSGCRVDLPGECSRMNREPRREPQWASILVLLDPSVEVPPVEMNTTPDTNDR